MATLGRKGVVVSMPNGVVAAKTTGPAPKVAKLKLMKLTVQIPVPRSQETALSTVEKSKLDEVNGTWQI